MLEELHVYHNIMYHFQILTCLSADLPMITEHSQNQSVASGADIAFSVEATGKDLQFQWQKGYEDYWQ